MSAEGDITVSIIPGDADAVHVIIEKFRRATSAVKTGDCSHVLSEILEAATRGEVVSLGAGKLFNMHFPFLCSNRGNLEGEGNIIDIFDGEVNVMSGEDSTEVGGKILVCDRISSSDCQSVIGAVAHHGSRNLKLIEINSDLGNLKSNIDYIEGPREKSSPRILQPPQRCHSAVRYLHQLKLW